MFEKPVPTKIWNKFILYSSILQKNIGRSLSRAILDDKIARDVKYVHWLVHYIIL